MVDFPTFLHNHPLFMGNNGQTVILISPNMAPSLRIEVNQQSHQNPTSPDYEGVNIASRSHVITDGHLDGNVIIFMPGNETANSSQQYLVEVTFEGNLPTKETLLRF